MFINTREVIEDVEKRGESLGKDPEATLWYWQRRGLIPRTIKVGRGRSRGVVGLYPIEVVDLIMTIKRLQKSGLTLDEILKVTKYQKDLKALKVKINTIKAKENILEKHVLFVLSGLKTLVQDIEIKEVDKLLKEEKRLMARHLSGKDISELPKTRAIIKTEVEDFKKRIDWVVRRKANKKYIPQIVHKKVKELFKALSKEGELIFDEKKEAKLIVKIQDFIEKQLKPAK